MCFPGRLYGSLLYKLNLKVLHIEDTPVEFIEEHTFLGVNETLSEIHLINSKLKEFPTPAFKVSLSILFKHNVKKREFKIIMKVPTPSQT